MFLRMQPSGSRVYGRPREDSDYDYFCLCSKEMFDKLQCTYWYGYPSGSSRIGAMNIVFTYDEKFYVASVEVVRSLILAAPVSRGTAVLAFQEAWGKLGYKPTKSEWSRP